MRPQRVVNSGRRRLYAPSGFAVDPEAVDRAVGRLEAMWERVVVDPTCRSRWQRFSAPDDERLAAVVRMANDPRVDLAITLRGGYGWTRLLAADRFSNAGRGRQAMAGLQRLHRVSAGGARACRDDDVRGTGGVRRFRRAGAVGVHVRSLLRLARSDRASKRSARSTVPTSTCAGTLWGGNLAMVVHLLGTPHFPRIDGGILFLEDVGETPYRIERMLYQLHHAGILARQRAILLGQFTEFELSANDGGYRARQRSGADAQRVPGAHPDRPAVRTRSRQADAAGRRSVRAVGAQRRTPSLAFSNYGG